MSTRRRFLINSSQVVAAVALVPDLLKTFSTSLAADPIGEIGYKQDPLVYSYAALEPSIDALTMEIHYTKHAAGYTKNMADALTAEKVDTTSVSITDLLKNILLGYRGLM